VEQHNILQPLFLQFLRDRLCTSLQWLHLYGDKEPCQTKPLFMKLTTPQIFHRMAINCYHLTELHTVTRFISILFHHNKHKYRKEKNTVKHKPNTKNEISSSTTENETEVTNTTILQSITSLKVSPDSLVVVQAMPAPIDMVNCDSLIISDSYLE